MATDLMIHPRGGLGPGGLARRSGSSTSMALLGSKSVSSSGRSGTPGGGYNTRSSSHQQPPIQRCPDGWSQLRGASTPSCSSNPNSRPGSAGAGRLKGGSTGASSSSSASFAGISNGNGSSNSNSNSSSGFTGISGGISGGSGGGASGSSGGGAVNKPSPTSWHQRPATRSYSTLGLHVAGSGSPSIRPHLSSSAASLQPSTSSSTSGALPPVTSSMTRTATNAGAESPTMGLAKLGGPSSGAAAAMMMGAVDSISGSGKGSAGHPGGSLGSLGSFGAGVPAGVGGVPGWSTSPSGGGGGGGGSPTRRSVTMSMTQTGSAPREQELMSFLTKFTEGNTHTGLASPGNHGPTLTAHERRHLEAHWRKVFRSADASSAGVLSAEQIKETVDRFALAGFGGCSSNINNNNNSTINSSNSNSSSNSTSAAAPSLESLRTALPSVLQNFGARGASGTINEEEFLAFALFAHSWMGQGANLQQQQQQQQQQLPHLLQQQQQQEQHAPHPSDFSPKRERHSLTLGDTFGKTAEFGKTFGEACSVHRQSPSFGLGPGSALAPLKSEMGLKDHTSEGHRWPIGLEGSLPEPSNHSGTSPTASSMHQQASLTEVITGGSSQSTGSLRPSGPNNSSPNPISSLPCAPPSPKNQPVQPPPPTQPVASMPPTPTRGGSVPFLPLDGLRRARSDMDAEELLDTEPSSTAAAVPAVTNSPSNCLHHHHQSNQTAAFPPSIPPPGASRDAEPAPPPPSLPPPPANESFIDRGGDPNWSIQGTGINHHLIQFNKNSHYSEVLGPSDNGRPKTRTSQSSFDAPPSRGHRSKQGSDLAGKLSEKGGKSRSRQGSKDQPNPGAVGEAAEFVPYDDQVPSRVDTAGETSPTRTPLSRSVVARQAGLPPSLRCSPGPSTGPPPSFGIEDDDDLQDAVTAPSGETDLCESSLMSDNTGPGSSVGQRKPSLTPSTCSSISVAANGNPGTASRQQQLEGANGVTAEVDVAAALAAAAASDDLSEWGFNEERQEPSPARRQVQPPWVKSTRPGSSSGRRAGSKESRRPPSGPSSRQASAQNTPRSTRSGISVASGSRLSRPPSRSGSKSSLLGGKGRRSSKRRVTYDNDAFDEAQQEAMRALVTGVSEGTTLGKLAFDLFAPTRSRDGRASFSPDVINEALRGVIRTRVSATVDEDGQMPIDEVDAMVARRSTVETVKEDAGLIIDVARRLEATTKMATRDTFGQILYRHRDDPSLQTDAHRAVANDLQWVVEPDQAQDVLEMVTSVFRELTRAKQGMMHCRHWMKAMDLMLANPVLSSRCSRQDPTRLFHAEAMRSVRRREQEAGDTAGGFTIDLNRFFALLVELAENMQVHPFMIFFAIGCHADVLKDKRRRHEAEDSTSLPPSRPRSRQNSIVEGQPGCPPPMPSTGGFR